MRNREYEPNEKEKAVIEVLREGRANPYLLRKRTGLSKQEVNYVLNQLTAAKWVEKVTEGLYELPVCPRGSSHVPPTELEETLYDRNPPTPMPQVDHGEEAPEHVPDLVRFELCRDCNEEWTLLPWDEQAEIFKNQVERWQNF